MKNSLDEAAGLDAENLSTQILSDITIFTKYAKYLPHLGRRETWEEICYRNAAMHIKKYPQLEDEINEVYANFVIPKKVLPSMRALQFSGKPIELAPSRIFNCSYLPIDDYRAFPEVILNLLFGCGVGVGVQKHNISKLPPIIKPVKTRRFVIGDSIEGWADAIKALVGAYLAGKALPKFDFSDIRQKGALLITSGGKAPGPEPLKDCIHNIKKILDRKENGEQLTSLEVHDVICFLADCVLAGGIRRAALISLFDINDLDMLSCKSGNWWELNPQRARANNSAVVVRHKVKKKDFFSLWEKIKASGCGEPGIFLTNDKTVGTNPCLAIDTHIATADGIHNSMSLKEIMELNKPVPVYCLDFEGNIAIRPLRGVQKTGEGQKIYKITLDNADVIRATGNHKFRLYNGEIRDAVCLEPGDSLWKITKFHTPNWNKKRTQDYVFIANKRKTKSEHRLIASWYYNFDIPSGSEYVVHHKDHNAINNSPDNLEIMTSQDHDALHNNNMFGENNPMVRAKTEWSKEKWDEYKRKSSENSTAESNGRYCGVSNDQLLEYAKKLTIKLNRRFSVVEWAEYAKEWGLPQNFSNWRKTHFGGISGFAKLAAIECEIEVFEGVDPRTIKKYQSSLKEGYDCSIINSRVIYNKICEITGKPFQTNNKFKSVVLEAARENSSKIFKKWWSNPLNKESAVKTMKLAQGEKKEIVREQQTKIYNDLEFNLNREPQKKEWIKACKESNVSFEISRKSSPFRKYDDLKQASKDYNHKVVSVEFDGIEDVYCGSVDEFHNFFIGNKNDEKTSAGKFRRTFVNTFQCGEISLKGNQYCNLTTLNASDIDTQEELNDRTRAAAFIGTLQAGYTDFHYLRDVWKKTTEKESLLGVSMTGIASGRYKKLNLIEAAEVVKDENIRVAKLININTAARLNSVKPEGSSSLVVGSSSGIHAWFDKYYIRRMKLGKNESLYKYLVKKIPELIEDDYFKPHLDAFVKIPVKAPQGAVIAPKETAMELLERVKHFNINWIKPGHIKGSNTHNVSATVYIKDHEWDEVGEWMWENREYYNGLAVLPFSDHTYIQAPHESITEEKYEEMIKYLKEIDLSKVKEVEDNTNLSGEIACGGDGCQII